MLLSARVLLLVGAAAIAAALVVAVLLRGMEFASWVAGSIGALSIASGLVVRALGASSGASGDRIEQRHVRARGRIVGKSGGGGEGDRIRQERLDAGGDVVGKQTVSDTDR
ncbi:hypothetical protein ACH347_34205 [Saccharopolyspora sp. 5N102]|uniref:hypothetical protein n=1 Tax=Saccharopolyspora sp. 5N102 TaxID=3375155 RepID=UPI0037B73A4E